MAVASGQRGGLFGMPAATSFWKEDARDWERGFREVIRGVRGFVLIWPFVDDNPKFHVLIVLPRAPRYIKSVCEWRR